MLLLAASYLFYSFAGLPYVIYILITTLTTYYISRRLSILQAAQADYLQRNKEILSREDRKKYKAEMKRKQRKWMVLCMVINFGILAVIKYAPRTGGR